jgi:PAS domain-containing protein
MNTRLFQYLRALLQPAPLIGVAIIVILWFSLGFLLPVDHEKLADYEHLRSLYFAVAGVLTVLEVITVAASIRRQLSLEQTNVRFNTALENMTHGLCMFDGNKRLVICNDRYASLYRLPPELAKAGATHEAVIAHRVMNGILKGEKNAGAVDKKLGALGKHSVEKVSSRVDELADGRLIRVVRQPMKDGGWVATHEDITERQQLSSSATPCWRRKTAGC